MSTITFSGLASGLDTGSIVSQLLAIRRQPIVRLENRKASFERQIAALGDLESKLNALKAAAEDLDTSQDFGSLAASTSHEDILTATANYLAVPGTYDITVNNLAGAQKEVYLGYDSLGADVGTGSISITVGEETVDVSIDAESGTLSGLRDAINAADAGVYATILNDGSETEPYRLVLTAAETGSDAAFSIDWSGLGGGTTPTVDVAEAAVNASLIIDGISVTAQTNTISEVVTGLTLDLIEADENTELSVTVASDPTEIQEKVNAFVTAYNSLATFIKDQSAEDGTLRTNPAMRTVRQRMSGLISQELASETADLTYLGQIGISMGRDGQLTLDETRFQDALNEDFTAVRDLFVQNGESLGKAYLIRQSINDLTDSFNGIFKIGKDTLNDKIDNIDDAVVRYERGVDSYRAYLEKKFTAMEAMLSQLQAQGNYLAYQFGG